MTDRATPGEPAPFTAEDFAARLQRAAAAAEAAGLTGLLLTPGPDLLYLTGYAPVAITERITMLVVPVDGEPTMIVPRLERPDAEEYAGPPSSGSRTGPTAAIPTRRRRGCSDQGVTPCRTRPGRCISSDCRAGCPRRRTRR